MKTPYLILIILALISVSLLAVLYFTKGNLFGIYANYPNGANCNNDQLCASNYCENTWGICCQSSNDNACLGLNPTQCNALCTGQSMPTTTLITSTTIQNTNQCNSDSDCCAYKTGSNQDLKWWDCYFSQGAQRYQCRGSSSYTDGYYDCGSVTCLGIGRSCGLLTLPCCSGYSCINGICSTPTTTPTTTIPSCPSNSDCQSNSDCCQYKTGMNQDLQWWQCYYSNGAGKCQCRGSSSHIQNYYDCGASTCTGIGLSCGGFLQKPCCGGLECIDGTCNNPPQCNVGNCVSDSDCCQFQTGMNADLKWWDCYCSQGSGKWQCRGSSSYINGYNLCSIIICSGLGSDCNLLKWCCDATNSEGRKLVCTNGKCDWGTPIKLCLIDSDCNDNNRCTIDKCEWFKCKNTFDKTIPGCDIIQNLPLNLILSSVFGIVGFIVPVVSVPKRKRSKGIIIGVILGLILALVVYYIFTYLFDLKSLIGG